MYNSGKDNFQLDLEKNIVFPGCQAGSSDGCAFLVSHTSYPNRSKCNYHHMNSLTKMTLLCSSLVAGLLLFPLLTIRPAYARSTAAASTTDYPVVKTASDIKDLLLRDAVLELIEATKQKSADALFRASLSSERVRAYFESFKVQHTSLAVERVSGPVRQACQAAINNFAWAELSNNTDLKNYFQCIVNQSQTMGFEIELPARSHSESGSSGGGSGN